MVLGIRATVDFAFKMVFGSPEHTSITIHFLNSVLNAKPRIVDVEILNPILGQETDEDKLSILDILARDEQGRLFNIEMQSSVREGLSHRLVYYVSSLLAGQLGEGVPYDELPGAINVSVLEQSLFPDPAQFHREFRLRDAQGLELTDRLQIHLLELPHSRADEHNIEEASDLERWAFFLKSAHRFEVDSLAQLLPSPPFQEAIGVLEMIQRTPRQQLLYEARLKMQRDEATRRKYALKEGREEGREEGQRLGQREGLIRELRLLERLLAMDPVAEETLAQLSFDDLSNKVAELETQALNRRG